MLDNNTNCPIDKELVAKRFAQARDTYDREACVQREVAEKMMRLIVAATKTSERALPSEGTLPTEKFLSAKRSLPAEGFLPAESSLPAERSLSAERLSARFRRVVEFGCGTGIYSRLLLQTLQPESLLLNDLCWEMEECVKELCDDTAVRFVPSDTKTPDSPHVSFLPGDAEALDFPEGTDLITSCSTLQWFNDPGAFFLRCHRSLAENGLLAFTTFGAANLREIRQLTGNGLNYLSVEELQALLSPGFDILHAEEEVTALSFPTPQAVLKHLKQTGVTGTEKRMWTRNRLQSFCEEYTARFGDAAGNVSLTYHPIYIIARKKH